MNFSTILIISPIILFSVVALAVILERIFFLRKNKVNIELYKNEKITNFTDFKQFVENKTEKTVFDYFLVDLLQQTFKSKEALKEYIDTNLSQISIKYDKRVYLIGVFARLATLLGLLGTVVGMISAFNNIVEKGISNAGIVASGISTALFTTAVGLIVAIPLTFFYEYLISKIDNEMKKMEIILSNMLTFLFNVSSK